MSCRTARQGCEARSTWGVVRAGERSETGPGKGRCSSLAGARRLACSRGRCLLTWASLQSTASTSSAGRRAEGRGGGSHTWSTTGQPTQTAAARSGSSCTCAGDPEAEEPELGRRQTCWAGEAGEVMVARQATPFAPSSLVVVAAAAPSRRTRPAGQRLPPCPSPANPPLALAFDAQPVFRRRPPRGTPVGSLTALQVEPLESRRRWLPSAVVLRRQRQRARSLLVERRQLRGSVCSQRRPAASLVTRRGSGGRARRPARTAPRPTLERRADHPSRQLTA